MKNIISSLLLTVFLSLSVSYAQVDLDPKAQILLKEYAQLKAKVLTLTPDGDVGGYFKFKNYGDVKLMWRFSRNEVIRLFYRKSDSIFAVTYYVSQDIVDERIVLRRFYGQEPLLWRNDTIDYNTGEYLGMQGMEEPELSKEDLEIMKQWGLTAF